ncbi:MAG: CHASE2 domain-containing protein, partial [Alphaproteobacteria bacterium]
MGVLKRRRHFLMRRSTVLSLASRVRSAGLCLAVLAAMIVARSVDPPPIEAVRLAAFDGFQRMAPRDYHPAPVRVVDIDEESLRRIGQWPWPRRKVASLIDRLGGMGPAAIGLDMVFPEADRTSPARLRPDLAAAGLVPPNGGADWPDYDAELADAIARNPVVTSFGLIGRPTAATPALKAGVALIGTDPASAIRRYAGAVSNLPALEAAAAGNGSFSVVSESDRVIRRMPLLAVLGDRIYPSLALETLRVAQGAGSLAIKSLDAGRAFDVGGGVASVRAGRVQADTTPDGHVWLRYAGDVPERS